MKTVKLKTEVPEDVYNTLLAHGWSRERLANKLLLSLAVELFKNKALSLGKASRLAGLSKWKFIDVLGRNQVPVIDYEEEILEEELNSVEKLYMELKD